MKVVKRAQLVVVSVAVLAGFAWSAFEGSDVEFLETIVAGNVPDGILPEDPEFHEERNLRNLKEPQQTGQRCGRNTPCAFGLQCVSAGFAKVCAPYNCIESVFSSFVEKHQLQNFPQTVVSQTGMDPKYSINETVANQGIRAIATQTSSLLRTDFRQSIQTSMAENAPPMTELLMQVVQNCNVGPRPQGEDFDQQPLPGDDGQNPQTEQEPPAAGVTVMLGLQYGCAGFLPKFFNSFYFAVGSSDIEVSAANTTDGGVSPGVNFTGGVYTDVCGGAGPAVGVEFQLVGGIVLTGSHTQIGGCSFLFDTDAGVGSSFGMAVGAAGATGDLVQQTRKIGFCSFFLEGATSPPVGVNAHW